LVWLIVNVLDLDLLFGFVCSVLYLYLYLNYCSKFLFVKLKAFRFISKEKKTVFVVAKDNVSRRARSLFWGRGSATIFYFDRRDDLMEFKLVCTTSSMMSIIDHPSCTSSRINNTITTSSCIKLVQFMELKSYHTGTAKIRHHNSKTQRKHETTGPCYNHSSGGIIDVDTTCTDVFLYLALSCKTAFTIFFFVKNDSGETIFTKVTIICWQNRRQKN
jgi:hypothetical protein